MKIEFQFMMLKGLKACCGAIQRVLDLLPTFLPHSFSLPSSHSPFSSPSLPPVSPSARVPHVCYQLGCDEVQTLKLCMIVISLLIQRTPSIKKHLTLLNKLVLLKCAARKTLRTTMSFVRLSFTLQYIGAQLYSHNRLESSGTLTGIYFNWY